MFADVTDESTVGPVFRRVVRRPGCREGVRRCRREGAQVWLDTRGFGTYLHQYILTLSKVYFFIEFHANDVRCK